MCRAVATSRSMARGSISALAHSSCVCSGARFQEALGAEGFAVFQQADLSHFVGQSVNILALGFKAPLLGDADELLRVFDLVVAALFGLVQGVHDLTAVVGVGGGAAGGEAQEVPAHDTVDVAAADAPGLFGVMRQGPMEQIRQQVPASPKPQWGSDS